MRQHNKLQPTKEAKDLVASWLEYLVQQGRSPNTVQAYRRALAHFLNWYQQVYQASLDLSSLMPRDIRQWKNQQQTQERAAAATINQRLVAVMKFLDWAVEKHYIPSNPAKDTKALQLPARQAQALKPVEVLRLLRAARGNLRDYALLELLIGTGIRVGELLDLKFADIDLHERSGKVTVRQGKGGNYREIPLTKEVRHALQAYFDSLEADFHSDESLWQGKRGPLRHRSSILRLLNRYARVSQLPSLHPHQLRHTFATRYLQANPSDLRGLAYLLGHVDIKTVLIYTEPTLDDLSERMERVEDYQF